MSNRSESEFVARQLRKPSGDFAAEIAEEMNRANRPLVELTFETMNVKDRDHLLEIGFGSGRFFPDLLNCARKLKVLGVDYSKEMVEQASVLNSDAIRSGSLELFLAASDDLPFDDHSFDKVYCNNVIYFWDDPTVHLMEIRRVLKIGGRFYSGFRSREHMSILPVVDYGFTLYSDDEWSSVLQENGLSVQEVTKKEEPELELDGQKIRFESICIMAEKVGY